MVSETPTGGAYLATLASEEKTVTVSAGAQLQPVYTGTSNTLTSMTLYISNAYALASNNLLDIYVTTWDTGVTTHLQLGQYRYGLYVENMPVGNISITNNTSVTVQVYLQTTLKQYAEPYNTAFQILTQLILLPTVVTQTLTGGTNFRYQGAISGLTFNTGTFPNGQTFYVLDQQVIGTSSSAAGSVSVPWSSKYTENLSVPSLGSSEDSTLYALVADSTTQLIPSNVVSTNASMNFVRMDFYSPMNETLTNGNVNIVYNTSTQEFECDDNITASYYSTYLPFVGAPLTVITNVLS